MSHLFQEEQRVYELVLEVVPSPPHRLDPLLGVGALLRVGGHKLHVQLGQFLGDGTCRRDSWVLNGKDHHDHSVSGNEV